MVPKDVQGTTVGRHCVVVEVAADYLAKPFPLRGDRQVHAPSQYDSADVVLNILARQRDPGPPATILTPAALTLHHAPIADCARYDNLRRTI